MNIFKHNKESIYKHILDPDYHYHTTSLEERMHDYFKELSCIEQAHNIAGIYIQYDIPHIIYEKHPLFYFKTSHHIEKIIEKYFDFGHSNLYNDYSNIFFITLFNVTEEQLQFAFLQIHQNLSLKNLQVGQKSYTFDIRCGVYISDIYISPSQFIHLAKEQYQNTNKHHDSLISIKNSTHSYISHNDDKNNESSL